MRYHYIALWLLLGTAAKAQQNYDVSLIPKELLSHAEAVVRANDISVDIKRMDAVTQHVKYVVTVLNSNGDGQASLYLFYNKSSQIKSVKGTIYDRDGKLMGQISEHNFLDHSTADGFSLFLDERYKYYKPAVTTYPYTIAYEYDLYDKQTLLLPDWNPNEQQAAGTSVEQSSYTLTCRSDFNIRYKALNYPGKVTITEVQGLKTYAWEIKNLKAQRNEPYSPMDDHRYTSVKIAPEKFSYAGVLGSFTNWEEYGKFMYDKLLKNRQQLTPETINYINDLTKDISDPKLKAKKIYEFMQQKTRYVSVQIGIGGYQPFTAMEVDQQSYGDCKALVNYTQSLLNVVGIESYYVLNMAGDTKQSALPDFASMNQFNHVILCLPFKNDTTWIDCTSKEYPFGYLGTFTDDRVVVACTRAGGKLMHTPTYPPPGNKLIREANFKLGTEGTLSGDMKTEFSGTQYGSREGLINETFDEQVKKIKEIYPIENLAIASYKLSQDKSADPVTAETIKLQARDYVAQNGGRFFMLPNIASRYVRPLKSVMNRSNDVYINRGYLDIDAITYDLPEGLSVKTQALNVSIERPFGKYSAVCYVSGHQLVYKRSLQINNGTYTKDTYSDLVDFYQAVYEADNYTVTMEKK